MIFNGVVNSITAGIWEMFIPKLGKNYPSLAKHIFWCTNNMIEYEACTLGIRKGLEMNVPELVIIGDSDL